MRKIFIVLLFICVVCGSAAAQTCDCSGLQDKIDALTAQIEILTERINVQELGQVKEIQDAAVLRFGSFDQVIIGDFTIDFYSQQQYETAKGDGILLLKLFFQNNSDETVSFASQIRVKAFQNGVGLPKYKADDHYLKEIGPGMSVVVAQVYQFMNHDQPIELIFTPRLEPKAEPIARMIAVK